MNFGNFFPLSDVTRNHELMIGKKVNVILMSICLPVGMFCEQIDEAKHFCLSDCLQSPQLYIWLHWQFSWYSSSWLSFFHALNTSHFRFRGLQRGSVRSGRLATTETCATRRIRSSSSTTEKQCSTALLLLLLRLAPKRPLEDDTREKREWKKWGWNIHIVSSSENKTTLHNTNDENTLAMLKKWENPLDSVLRNKSCWSLFCHFHPNFLIHILLLLDARIIWRSLFYEGNISS